MFFTHCSVTLKFPQNTDDVKSLIKELRAVRDGHWMSVLIMFSSAYLYKQTFAIPGSALLVRLIINVVTHNGNHSYSQWKINNICKN